MSSSDIRVAEALHLIADHVRKRGMEHPEGLTVSLPLPESGGEVIVTAHVYVEEPSAAPTKRIYDGKL